MAKTDKEEKPKDFKKRPKHKKWSLIAALKHGNN